MKKKKRIKLLARIRKSIPTNNTGMTVGELEEIKRDNAILKIFDKYLFVEDGIICSKTVASVHLRKYINKLIKEACNKKKKNG